MHALVVGYFHGISHPHLTNRTLPLLLTQALVLVEHHSFPVEERLAADLAFDFSLLLGAVVVQQVLLVVMQLGEWTVQTALILTLDLQVAGPLVAREISRCHEGGLTPVHGALELGPANRC